MDLVDFLTLAHRMSDAAGEVIRRYWQTPMAIERKGDASPVTKADKEAESAIRAIIEKELPGHGIIGEEFGNVREQSPWQWVLDPIDGTRSFIAGYPMFATLIGLAKDGMPVLGIIDQPVSRERWVGVQNKPTTLNGNAIKTRKADALGQALVATASFLYTSPEERQAFEQLRRQCGSAMLAGDAYAFGRLAEGRIDLVVDAGLKPYDFIALRPVIEGAGGVITDWQGNAVTLKSTGRIIAAASAALHKQALSCLQSAI